jgi:uncharacterized Zn finger protein
MQGPCEHKRTEVIARQDGEEYVRCLDCGQVYEAGDLEPIPLPQENDEEER